MIKPNKQPVMYTLELTEDEVYTLQLLTGHVAQDDECYSIGRKLDDLIGVIPLSGDDYDYVKFYTGEGSEEGLSLIEYDVTILINND